jgi:hypothetical protein
MELSAEAAHRQQEMAHVAAMMIKRMRLAQTRFDYYVEMVCRDNLGHAIKLAEMHRSWIRHVEYCWARGLRALILAPFGHGKSSSLVVPLCSWLMGRDISTRIKIITNDDNSASERLMACKRTIESSSFRQVFPTVRRGDRWNNHELFLKRSGYSTIDPTLHARGIWTTGVGSRADYMFFDDAVDQKNSTDDAQRKKVLSFIEGTWLNRLEPTGHVLGIGTAWHAADANHVLMQRAGWCTLIHRISADCTRIEQEVLGARDGQYPMPIAA